MKKMIRTRRWLTVSACAVTLGAGLALAEGHGVKNRQKRQQRRIAQGVKSGELTRRETLKLQNNAARIRLSTVKDRKDGGVFTPRERVKAQKQLNKQSRAIYRQKHDAQQR